MIINLRNPIAFFDLETTGVNISQDRIISISLIKIFPGNEQEKKEYLINPGIPIPAESSLIHGIYDEDIKGKPSFKEIARNLAKFLEGTDLAGFSIINFDVPMLVEEFLRAEVEFDIRKKKIVDAQKIFHLMEKRTLTAAYKFYCNKELANAHNASADTLASLEVLEAQVQKYSGNEVTDLLGNPLGQLENDMEVLHKLTISNKVDLAGRLAFDDNGIEVFNFGKHKGKKVTDIFEQEPQYYDWIMKGDFPLDTKRRITEIKLRGFKK
ncbi:MAG TPA: 3'-5' exonuclease [Cyclobacteriaceae bacterium]|jgi:DNA polymerase-3 subunit epsilon